MTSNFPFKVTALLLAGLAASNASSVGVARAAQGSTSGSASGVAAVSSGAIRSAADGPTRAFYEARQWRAAWTPQAIEELRQVLGTRNGHGLDHLTFLEESASAGDAAARDVAFTKAALRYAVALSRGAADPNKIYDVYTLPGVQTNLVAGLNDALQKGSLADWLNGLAPQNEAYKVLSRAYVGAQMGAGQSSSSIGGGGLIKEGDSGQRVQAVIQRLQELGYLQSQQRGSTYISEVAQAVERLQADYGLSIDGVVGPRTMDALTFDAAARARALAVALERMRWLERNPPANRIDVNIAAADLEYYRDGALADRRKVVVGEPANPTPQLQSGLYRLVANPTWTVPKSIERNELANVSSSYLRNRDMVRKDGWIVQQSGPENALGLVKFDMDNKHAIYLHDTNAPHLFTEEQRYFSHGCVRVEDALGFAETLASDAQIMSDWQAARAEDKETFVRLPEQIPVRLVYQDVFVRDGQPVFRLDPYGWNDEVAVKLGFEAGSRKPIQLKARDIGP
ncbi:L,D-transpeptidase family protein [Novosphingobium sp. RD2P27]|uniref:L,D-transpeptidase family protein n=1 Tax=Novosphingobium kalidii TaxID=3230299 RepID=A0ABV2CWJ1_9SPHN